MLPSRRRRIVAAQAALAVLLGLALSPARADGDPEALSAAFRKAAKRVAPAVVTIRAGLGRGLPPGAAVGALARGAQLVPDLPADNPSASGVVIDAAKGYVLTNDHIVLGAARVVVVLHDGSEREATQIRHDTRSDLALLTINGKGLSQVDWGDSEALEPGDWVLAVGRPFGLATTLAAGIVSGKGHGPSASIRKDFLQTDAAITPGNSGGALVNLKGEVVGINTAITNLAGGYDGVGLAIPSARARRVAADLGVAGRVRRAYLGVQVAQVDPATAERLNEPGAVAINGVAPGSPADEAGLLRGDVLVRLGDQPLRGPASLQNAIEVATIGAPLHLVVDRNGEPKTLTITPREQPDAFLSQTGLQVPLAPGPGRGFLREFQRAIPPGMFASPSAEVPGATAFPEFGLHLIEQTRSAGNRAIPRGERPGLLITAVDPASPADLNGLEAGMVITDVDKQRVGTLDDLRAILAKRPKDHDLVVRILKGAKPEFRVLMSPETGPKTDDKPAPDTNPPGDAPKNS